MAAAPLMSVSSLGAESASVGGRSGLVATKSGASRMLRGPRARRGAAGGARARARTKREGGLRSRVKEARGARVGAVAESA